MEAQQVEIAQNEWVQIDNHPEYDIQTRYPFLIRKRANRRIIKLTPNNRDNYLRCRLSDRTCLHHRVIAEQFIPNPNNLDDIDHVNHQRDDNHLENLRWASRTDNLRNKSNYRGFNYEYIDELPADAITIEEWNGHRFDGLYYIGKGHFVLFNGVKFRKLAHVLVHDSYHITAYDVEHRQVNINVAKYRIRIDDVPIAEPSDEDNIVN
jgi:hypothetical protein